MGETVTPYMGEMVTPYKRYRLPIERTYSLFADFCGKVFLQYGVCSVDVRNKQAIYWFLQNSAKNWYLPDGSIEGS
jgi:hypothetical protein